MRETIKTIIYTCVLTLILLILFILNIFIFDDDYESEKLTILPISEPYAFLATEKLKEFEYFRNPYVTSDTVSNLEMIYYIFENLKKDDYEIRRIQPLKVVCQVTSDVSFVSDDVCRILVIDNEKLNNYKDMLFDYNKDIEYIDFKYNGFDCINDDGKYYCLIEEYKEESDFKEYSLVDEIYNDENDNIILYEYYLVYRDDECSNYYSEVYCEEDSEYININEDIIRKYGVYYRHEFVVNDDELNLVKSFIIND